MALRNPTRLLFALLLAAGAPAAERYVQASAAAGGDGSAARPYTRIQTAVTAAQPGDTVWIRAGTYREEITVAKVATAAAPLTIAGFPGERPLLLGSERATGWQPHAGATWRIANWPHDSQQVIVDGVPLQQIGLPRGLGTGIEVDGTRMITPVGSGLADLRPGSFWYDAATRTLYAWLADSGDPNARQIEASARKRILFLGASRHVRIANLSFRHTSGTATGTGGVGVELGDDCTLSDSDVRFCDFAGVNLGWRRTGMRVERVLVADNGCVGINGSASYGFRVDGCELSRNNSRGFNVQWHAGGAKLTSKAHGVFERCLVAGNRGQGIWFDYANGGQPIAVRGCDVTGNVERGGGIMVECSRNVVIEGCVIRGNDLRGVYIASSDQVDVVGNTFWGNRGDTALDISGMPRTGATLTAVRALNNLFVDNLGKRDLMVLQENGTDIVGLRLDHNVFHRGGGTPLLWYGLDGRSGWRGTTYTSLPAWCAATPHDDASLQGDARLRDAAAGDWRLRADSIAVDRGYPCVASVDFLGRARVVGDAVDIGACEEASPRLGAPAAATGVVGQPFSWRIDASCGPQSYSATPLPPGLTLDASSGVISGVPTAGGVTAVRIAAVNSDGEAAALLTLTIDGPPTVSAWATPAAVSGTTATLSASASDDGGVPSCRWSQLSGPAAAIADATALESAVRFSAAGAHVFAVTVTDARGLTAQATVEVAVSATPNAIAVAPGTVTLPLRGVASLGAAVTDQFGAPMPGAAVTWSVDGGGSVDGQGRFTAGDAAGAWTATASSGGAHGGIVITVEDRLPTVMLTAPGDGSSVTAPATVMLAATAADDGGTVRVEFLVDDVVVGTVAAPPYAWSWPATVGTHRVAARAIDARGQSALSTTASITVARALLSAKVNFQPAGSAAVPGYRVDSGLAFGDRGGASYGWDRATPDARDRGVHPDQRYDTCVLMQAAANPTARWELALPAGTYRVRVVCGDPAFFDGRFALDAEGVRCVEGVVSRTEPFREGTVTVTVRDGRLTLSNATGSYNTKLCFVEVEEVPTAPAGNG